MRWLAPALLLAASTAASATSCPLSPDDGSLLSGDAISLAWQLPDGPIQASAPFSVIVRACPTDTELIAVDATMPAHRHGMNYAPSITLIAPGHWRVDGLLWHMVGHWELSFDLRPAGTRKPIERLRQAVMLR